MKKIISLVLISSFFLNSLAFAEDDDRVQYAKKSLEVTKKYFYDDLKAHTRLSSLLYFKKRGEDFIRVTEILIQKKNEQKNRLAEIKTQWKKLSDILSQDFSGFEKESVQIQLLVSEMKSYVVLANLLARDASDLFLAWKSRCDAKTLQPLKDYISPKNSADLVSFDPADPSGASFTVGLSISASDLSAPSVSGSYTGSAPYAEGAVTTVGSAVGMYLVEEGIIKASVAVGGVIGGAIAVGAIILFNLFKAALANVNPWPYVSQAYEFQKKTIEEKEDELLNTVDTDCVTALSDDWGRGQELQKKGIVVSSFLENLSQDFKYHAAIFAGHGKKIQEDYQVFLERNKDFLEILEQTYYPKLQASYGQLLKQRLEDRLQVDSEVRSFRNEVIFPNLNEYQKTTQEGLELLMQIEYGHRLWDALIMGDSRFGVDSDFIFIEKKGNPDLWSSVGKVVLKRIEANRDKK